MRKKKDSERAAVRERNSSGRRYQDRRICLRYTGFEHVASWREANKDSTVEALLCGGLSQQP